MSRWLLFGLLLTVGCSSPTPGDLWNASRQYRDTDPEKAVALFQEGAAMLEDQVAEGDPQAKQHLGMMMALPYMRRQGWPEGVSHRPDSLRGVRLLEEAAEAGESNALLYLAMLHTMRGEDEAAFALTMQGAEAGSPHAQAGVATHLLTGKGTPPDVDRALHWYRRALTEGDDAMRWQTGNNLRMLVHAGFVSEERAREELALAALATQP